MLIGLIIGDRGNASDEIVEAHAEFDAKTAETAPFPPRGHFNHLVTVTGIESCQRIPDEGEDVVFVL